MLIAAGGLLVRAREPAPQKEASRSDRRDKEGDRGSWAPGPRRIPGEGVHQIGHRCEAVRGVGRTAALQRERDAGRGRVGRGREGLGERHAEAVLVGRRCDHRAGFDLRRHVARRAGDAAARPGGASGMLGLAGHAEIDHAHASIGAE